MSIYQDNIAHLGNNCTLSYKYGGNTYSAKVRCRDIDLDWEITGSESHARQARAFYPYQRTQGSFSIVIECVGWQEYRVFAMWLYTYCQRVLSDSVNPIPPPMQVQCDARKLLRLGILTTGISYGDHVGSMVFAPELKFISVSDPGDRIANVLTVGATSQQDLTAVEKQARSWFYPASNRYSAAVVQAEVLYGEISQIVDSHANDPVTGTGATNPDNPRQTTG